MLWLFLQAKYGLVERRAVLLFHQIYRLYYLGNGYMLVLIGLEGYLFHLLQQAAERNASAYALAQGHGIHEEPNQRFYLWQGSVTHGRAHGNIFLT